MEKEQCKARVWGGYYDWPCSRKAVTDGYCKQHHPDAVAAREKASQERYEESLKRRPSYKLDKLKADLRKLVEEMKRGTVGIGEWGDGYRVAIKIWLEQIEDLLDDSHTDRGRLRPLPGENKTLCHAADKIEALTGGE